MLLGETLTKAVRFFAGKKVIVCGEDRFTYGELADRVYRLANGLNRMGIGRDGKVAVLHPNCHVFMEAYYGAAMIGAALVPINYRLSPREVAYILEDSESQILIASPEFKQTVDEVLARARGTPEILLSGKGGSYEHFLANA